MEPLKFFRHTLAQALLNPTPLDVPVERWPAVSLKIEPLGLNYLHMVNTYLHRSMLFFLKDLLHQASQKGLQPPHHLFISFKPLHSEIVIPEFLKDNSQPHLSIVLEDNFANLQVDPKGFKVVLFFEGRPHPLFIPWGCVVRFADPSLPFDCEIEALDTTLLNEATTPPPHSLHSTPGTIVDLAAFRQNHTKKLR